MLIDAHTHIFPLSQRDHRGAIAAGDPGFAAIYAGPKAKMATAEELVDALDHAAMDAAVAAGFAFAGAREIDEQNRYLAEAQRAGRGRIRALATLNLSHAGWRRAAEAALADGCAGFGELRPQDQGWDPLGPGSHELCDLAAAAGAVLLWHVSEPLGHEYPGKRGGIAPADLGVLAAAHPATRMVAAHLGGGLSFYLQMPEMRAALANVSFDTAAASLLYDPQSVARLVDLAGPGRVLFASDYPLLSPLHQLGRVRATLNDDAARAVCGGNAGSLFFASSPALPGESRD